MRHFPLDLFRVGDGQGVEASPENRGRERGKAISGRRDNISRLKLKA